MADYAAIGDSSGSADASSGSTTNNDSNTSSTTSSESNSNSNNNSSISFESNTNENTNNTSNTSSEASSVSNNIFNSPNESTTTPVNESSPSPSPSPYVPASSPNSVPSPVLPPTDQPINGEQARKLAQALIHKYFTTQLTPLTKHHLDSYDQFLERDLRYIIASKNPLVILKNHKAQRGSNVYKYKIEIDFGGRDASEIRIGTPTLQLNKGQDIRALFPNEARLRNLNYAVPIEMNVYVKVTIALEGEAEPLVETIKLENMNLCNFPLMLHSQYCILNGKSPAVLSEMGECPQDQGGYFIVDGSEKVLVTRQEGAFNTLWITPQPADENVAYFCSITSLNPTSREVRKVNFYWTREKIAMTRGFKKQSVLKQSVLEVQIPYVLKPIPIFVLFRAMGIETDKEILQLIFPDFKQPEAEYMADMLIPSINAAAPFLDSYSAIQYIKSLTKGFSVYHVMDILHNQLFPHVEDYPGARAAFLADCVRKILRVARGLDQPASRDDVRNSRLLTSGFLCQMLFQNIYKTYLQKVTRTIDEMFNYNESEYTDSNFLNIFAESNRRAVFSYGFMTEGVMRGFKGKWMTGANKEEQGVLQELSRLSYLDFISHLRHAVLNFDTSMKLAGPRHLRGSQYGYFCTSETPSGASIGITKNLTIMTSISNGMIPTEFTKWLFSRGGVVQCNMMTPQLAAVMIPVYLNSGIIGYTGEPKLLTRVLRLLKRTGCLPPLSSSGFSIPERRIFIYTDDGRPLRPLICFHQRGKFPDPNKFKGSWRDLVVGTLPQTEGIPIKSRAWIDPLAEKATVSLEEYEAALVEHQGVIEYLDPSEQNEALISNVPEHILPETTHMEVHPSTILGLLGNCIPYPNHNQSPRNQLSASQSKQSLSIYATNFANRFDNTANVLCYGQAPLSRTIYQDYFGDGKMTYGQNIILAMGTYGGYNQEDGIIMNADALARGQFRSLNFRSYETREEDDNMAKIQMRIGNPKSVPAWMDLKPNLDYTMLDENGYIKVGSYVTQTTVIVGRYMMSESGKISDASLTPQVWTRGRVESVVVTVNNLGFRLVKVRVAQDRVPELGDKFSNRHGQKGTLNVMYRGHDMPRTADGITPDMIMNPTALPSRMTIGQILEMMFGNVAAELGAIANTTAFMNDGSPHEVLGNILERLGLNRLCNQVLYNGITGEQIQADIYMGVVYGMRLKHMTEDKWNARGQGRKEMRTHQPTGGRGNEGGLKIGEMDRDAILAHAISSFLQESMMARSDGTEFIVCNGCGTIPIYNEKENLYLCPLCDGPIQFIGHKEFNLEPIPPPVRSGATFSRIEIPYASKLWIQEMETFGNVSMRILTTRNVTRLRGIHKLTEITAAEAAAILSQPIPKAPVPETQVPDLETQGPPAPTELDIEKAAADLRLAQEEAVAAERAAATAAVVTPLATNVLEAQAAANLGLAPGSIPQPQQQNTLLNNFNTQQPFVSQASSLTPTTEGQVELATGSIAPIPQTEPLVVPNSVTFLPTTQEGGALMTTSQGTPVINIDTSSAALAADGYKLPGDATASLMPAFPNFPEDELPRRRRSSSPRRQQYGGQQPQQQGHAPESNAMPQPSAPVTVVKLG